VITVPRTRYVDDYYDVPRSYYVDDVITAPRARYVDDYYYDDYCYYDVPHLSGEWRRGGYGYGGRYGGYGRSYRRYFD
jgi:hypothetical protein